MIFSPRPWTHRFASVAALILMAACGGSQVDPFEPRRIVAFGDQTSAIESNGLKYTVNYADAETQVLECKENPNWVQVVSNDYGFSFEQCHDDDEVPESKLYAADGAKVADIVEQIDTHLAADELTDEDLVLMVGGMNDVLEQYAKYAANPGAGTGALEDELERRAKALGRQVKRITDIGARIIVLRPYSLSSTPFSAVEEDANEAADDAAGRDHRGRILARLTEAFNLALLLAMPNDGTKVGTVDGLNTINAMVRRPENYSLDNVEDALCRASIEAPACLTRESDLQEVDYNDDNTEFTTPYSWNEWLWADNLNLSPRGHARLGSLARSRAKNNPF